MTTNQPLSLFISSKMEELAEERRAVKSALSAYQMYGWLFEQDAGARPESIESTYLTEVEACDIYIGIFWLGYGSYTIEEFERARALKKLCLIYEKRGDIDQRDPRLTAFLESIQHVKDPTGLTVSRFYTPEELAAQVQKSVMHLLVTRFREKRQQPAPLQVWNIPFHRNPFFTGREQLLEELHTNWIQGGAVALTQAISGLGGIGKTQIVVEYAYRYRVEYQAILWVSAASQETLIADCVKLNELLDLPQKYEQDQSIIVDAVKRWLQQHEQWLLILDNVDDLELVDEFIPAGGRGHVLLTTRAQAVGLLAHSMKVERMNRDEGTLFLLRRVGILAANEMLEQVSAKECVEATAIVQEMGELPLALDQAGAYIAETRCSFATYLNRYRTQQLVLLQRRGSTFGGSHPEPVTATWALSFERVQQQNVEAVDLLYLCALLAPDTIPEELVVEGAKELGPHLALLDDDDTLLDKAIGTLLRYSLIERSQQNGTLTIHRLVQMALRTSMDREVQNEWTERAIKALNLVFPSGAFSTWSKCQRLLPHALVVVNMLSDEIEHWELARELAQLLLRIADYLSARAQYAEAEPLYLRLLQIIEQHLGTENLSTATVLNNLASLYRMQGRLVEAKPLFQRSLHIREEQLGTDDLEMALPLNNLAALYILQGRDAEAEPLFQRALHIMEEHLPGSGHLDTALPLNNIAHIYFQQGKDAKAEALFQQALHIMEEHLERDHPQIAYPLNNLATLYLQQSKDTEAEPLLHRAVQIWEQLDPHYPDLALVLSNLAVLYLLQDKKAEAGSLFQRSLQIAERLGSDNPQMALLLSNQADFYSSQDKDEEAEPLYQRALQLMEERLGPDHLQVANPLNGLAELYWGQGKYVEAEALFLRALQIREKWLGPDHIQISMSLEGLAKLYRVQGKYVKAEPLYQRALQIREKWLGPDHHLLANLLEGLAKLYYLQDKNKQAEVLYTRALQIREQHRGSDHLDLAYALTGLADIYREQFKVFKAQSLYEYVLAIRQKHLEPDHLDIASALEKLAFFYRDIGAPMTAALLFHRAVQIKEQKLGHEHTKTRKARKEYLHLRWLSIVIYCGLLLLFCILLIVVILLIWFFRKFEVWGWIALALDVLTGLRLAIGGYSDYTLRRYMKRQITNSKSD